jgi:transposase InsO family protein
LKPSRKRVLIDELRGPLLRQFEANLRVAQAIAHRVRLQISARDSSVLLMRIKEIAATRVHYGYRRVHVLLKREGFKDNHKRVYLLSLEDAKRKIDEWRQYYNEMRPHSALQWATPAEFARRARENALPDRPTKPEFSTLDRY